MTRIAIFHNLPSGGAKRVVWEQTRELVRRGHDIFEYSLTTADLGFMPLGDFVAATHVYELRWDDLRPVSVPGLGPYAHIRWNRANLERLSRQSRQVAADIDSQGFSLVMVTDCRYTIAPYLLRYLRTPTIFFIHSDPVFRSAAEVVSPTGLMQKIRARPIHQHEHMVYEAFITNLRHADRVLTNSNFSRERIRSRHGVDAHVVYPGIDLTVYYPRPRTEATNFVLSAGRLLEQKGHEFIIEALGTISSRTRPPLVITTPDVDEIGERRLLQLAAEHRVVVEIRTVRDSDEMARLYSDATALLFAPTNETLGLVALEAMACGTPVVGVSEGGLVETIQDGRTGFLVERDPGEFARAVERLLADDALRDSFGRNARDYISAYWTWDRAVDDLEIEFSALLDAGVTVK